MFKDKQTMLESVERYDKLYNEMQDIKDRFREHFVEYIGEVLDEFDAHCEKRFHGYDYERGEIVYTDYLGNELRIPEQFFFDVDFNCNMITTAQNERFLSKCKRETKENEEYQQFLKLKEKFEGKSNA